MTNAIESDSSADAGAASEPVAEATYEVVFCAPAESVRAQRPRWFIEGCYSQFADAQRAAHELIAATNEQLHAVTILHAQFDPQRGAFRERVVWSQDRSIALLSRLNLQPLEAAQRASIVAHCDSRARDAAARRPTPSLPETGGPSAVVVGLASTLTAACCAVGVLIFLV